jgi:signal transduction histidine kinase
VRCTHFALPTAALQICGRGLCWVAATLCCLLASLLCPTASADEPLPRSVLVIDQFEPASAASEALLSAFRSTLKDSAAAPTSVYIENLDLGRFKGPRFEDAVYAYFHEKYRDHPIGVITAFGSRALELVLRLRPRLWPQAPVIFSVVDHDIVDTLALPPEVVGATVKPPLSDAASVARAIVPGLKRIAVVGDPPERQFIRRNVQAQLDALAADLELIDLMRLSMAELKQRVASLPSDAAILYIGLTLDAANVSYTSHEALTILAGVANRPIVVQAETHVGTGAVGGIVARPASMGREAAQLASRVLNGEAPSGIPTVASAMTPVFDWRQLQRWNISEDMLPAGSEVRFRAPTMWEQYRWYIAAALALFALQAALILVLLLNGRRLRRADADRCRAEEAAHEFSGRLINAQEEERSRLARELHDDVTQRLASLAIDAGREERRLLSPAEGNAMRSMREGLVRLSEDVHALSYRLHPSILEDLGLVEALQSERERFSRICPVRLEINMQDVSDKVPHDVALCLFRIAQEGLHNIARHAGATRAEVRLRPLNGGLQLVVKDNGVGFDPAKHHAGASLGHAGMRQRVFFLGGTIGIDSSPGHGTMIHAWVPLKGEQREPTARVAG